MITEQVGDVLGSAWAHSRFSRAFSWTCSNWIAIKSLSDDKWMPSFRMQFIRSNNYKAHDWTPERITCLTWRGALLESAKTHILTDGRGNHENLLWLSNRNVKKDVHFKVSIIILTGRALIEILADQTFFHRRYFKIWLIRWRKDKKRMTIKCLLLDCQALDHKTDSVRWHDRKRHWG